MCRFMVIAVTMVALMVGVAAAASLPAYDISTYCKMVGDAGDGSYTIESGCRDMEREAEAALTRMNIEPRILTYCDSVAKAGGGSYSIFQSCIEMEMGSQKSLGK